MRIKRNLLKVARCVKQEDPSIQAFDLFVSLLFNRENWTITDYENPSRYEKDSLHILTDFRNQYYSVKIIIFLRLDSERKRELYSLFWVNWRHTRQRKLHRRIDSSSSVYMPGRGLFMAFIKINSTNVCALDIYAPILHSPNNIVAAANRHFRGRRVR